MRFPWSFISPALIALAPLALSCRTAPAPSPPTSSAPPAVESAASDPASVRPEIWPVVENPIPPDPRLERRVDEIVGRMSLEEKVGQVVQASITHVSPDDVKRYHLGSVLNGGGGWPGDVRKATPADWLARADAYHQASVDPAGGRVAIPVVWGTDAVHGHNNIVGATLFPHNIGLGAMRNPELIRRIGEVTAREMRTTGIDWNFSPTVAVARDDRWGRTYESWSEDPEIVRAYAREMILGLQGVPGTAGFLGRGKVIATAKHFIGDGGTAGGKDQGDARASETELRQVHSAGYVGAIGAGAQAVMASFSSWQGVKVHGNRGLLTEVLKRRMGFEGLLVGDWNAHGQVPGCTNSSCARAINAGIDMFMVPEDWKALWESTLAQVRSGEIARERLDDAVRRIVRVKLRAGLFEAGKPSSRPLAGEFALLGAAPHRAVARQAVRESLVLLKNDGNVLPLPPGRHILVAGDGANDVGKQCGGWTLTWQGDGNRNSDFPGASSIWEGIRERVEAAGGTAVLSESGGFDRRPDAAIVVFGEDPYAEFSGDRANLVYDGEADLAILRRLQQAGVPVISVFLSGRPLWVNPHLNASDAFVAAWLPGTEGDGVAEMLFTDPDGRVRHDFRGKLSFSWPRHPTQLVLNRGDASYDPLFPYGYGLTYADRVELPELPTDLSGVATARSDVFFAGGAVAPWELFVADAAGRVRAGSVPVTSPRGAVSLRPVDRGVQEGGREARWSGGQVGGVFLAAEPPADFTRESNGNLAFALEVLVGRPPTRPVSLEMGCGEGCGGEVDLTRLLRSLPPGQWTSLRVRLRCFEEAGADMGRIDVPMHLATDGLLTLSFAEVRLAPATDAEAACPP
ncbi:MAG TPA: exo 1,3/1,4-beta-D-glucan glucohydrolase [Thermoanaerobaculia bacterium]|nr:exo 1,3/1,4-beta-D-glucan glucohydrolase [Thermoanaerobaculia bacterium]